MAEREERNDNPTSRSKDEDIVGKPSDQEADDDFEDDDANDVDDLDVEEGE